MDYVIQKNGLPEGYIYTSEAERRKYKILREGAEFKVDNKKVWQIIKKLVSGTNVWSCIEKYDKKEDGRGAWMALCAYYDGQ